MVNHGADVMVLATAGMSELTKAEVAGIITFLCVLLVFVGFVLAVLFCLAAKGDQAIARIKRERQARQRGFEVKRNTGETPVPLKDTNHGSMIRAERNDDHG